MEILSNKHGLDAHDLENCAHTQSVSATTLSLGEGRGEGCSRRAIHKTQRAAFTLAEVLIALGVIGVVAAMTIPNLMQSISEKVKKNKIEVFEKKLKTGMDLLHVENGIGPYYANTREFVERLSKHLKIAAICDVDHLNECLPYDNIILRSGATKAVNNYKTGADFGLIDDENNDYSSPNVGIILGDGTGMILNYNLKCPITDPDSRNDNSTACISGLYDINGAKGPNKRGVDVIGFNAGYGTPFIPTPLTYDDCMANKDKLGIKNCCPVNGTSDYDHCSNKDYWAGAVKTCGGIENMPTMEMLATLASNMYRINEGGGNYSTITIEPYKRYATPTTISNNSTANGGTWNPSDWISTPGLEFNANSSAAKTIGLSPWFALWSRRQYSASNAYNRNFGPSHTYYGNNWRGYSNHHGVCLGE